MGGLVPRRQADRVRGVRGRQGPAHVPGDLTGGAPKALTPDGVAERANTISPDGKWIVARQNDTLQLFPIDGGAPRAIAGASPEDRPLGWRADGRALFVRAGCQ